MYQHMCLVGHVITQPVMRQTCNDGLCTDFSVIIADQITDQGTMVNIAAQSHLAEYALQLERDDVIFIIGEVQVPVVQFDVHNHAFAVLTVTANVIKRLNRDPTRVQIVQQLYSQHIPPMHVWPPGIPRRSSAMKERI